MRSIIDQLINSTDNDLYRKIVRAMWIGVVASIAIVLLTFFILSFSNLPSVEQLENPKSEEATQIFGANGDVLGRYYTENRVPVTYDELSPNLINALIATEDKRYFRHTGIDFRALGRTAIKTVLLGDQSAGGASTITQQLAKLLFTGQPGSGFARVVQKFKEWIIAVRLERRYTKEEIIQMYLNKFNFIYGAYGIKAAAEIYFNTRQDSLEVNEAAMLVGMLKNPSLYNPVSRPDIALKRRNVVLMQMKKRGLLNAAEFDSLRAMPTGLRYTRKTHIDGIATYFRMELAKDVKAILSRPENRKSDGREYNIYVDGLKIYTTIDPVLQQIAEEEMLKQMAKLQREMHLEWTKQKLDPWTYRSRSDKEVPVEIRQQTLQRLIRETDRYQDLRRHNLQDVLEAIERQFKGVIFSTDDRELERIIAEHRKPGYLSELVNRGTLNASLAAKYRQIIKSDYFPTLMMRWDQLKEAADRAFTTPVNMRVFAYNDQLETDTLMSPIDSIKYHRFFLQTGILAVEPVTGHVKVWVGGINHKYFQFDHVRTNRQVGSTFKPFIYATAIAQQGFSPCFQVYDLEQTISPEDGTFGLLDKWTPRNFDGKYTGNLYTLKEGLRLSKNTLSVFLMKQLGSTEPVRGMIHIMGIDSSARYPNGRYRVPKSPSICLGATDLTVMEMTGAYTTFANNGLYNRPTYILRIEDKNGRVIYEEIPEERQAMPPNANYVMIEMLRYSAGVGGLKSDVGGKTGTTNDFVDGWYMGITPTLVVGTWVGGADRWVHFRSSARGVGAHMAKPFFRAFMTRLENNANVDYDVAARFYRPPGDLGIELDCSKYGRPRPGDDEFEEEIFAEDMFGDETPRTNLDLEQPFQR
jgi:penicillin-binding protein 1A